MSTLAKTVTFCVKKSSSQIYNYFFGTQSISVTTQKKYGFFETFFENPKMDIFKMSKIDFSFHFVLFFETRKKYVKNIKYFVTIYGVIIYLYVSARE